MSNAMATLSDDEDDGLQDPIRLFHYEQNRVLKHSEINSFTIEDFGYVEEFDIHPVNCLHFDKDKQLVQKRLNCDAKPLEEYSNSNTKGQNSEIIVPTGGEATNLENQNINISANTAHVEKQLETSIMAKRSYDIHKAQPAREINFKKNIGLTGMKIVQKDIIVDDESDDNQCESSKTLKRKAYDSKVEKKNYDDVYERIISKAYQREKNNAMHFNIIKKASASVNTNNVIKKLNDGRKQLEEANMCQIRDSIVPKKIRRSKSLHISSSDSLTKCTLRNFVAAEGIKKAENVDINTSNRIKHAKIVKSKSIAAVIQTKKVITNDVTKSCSKEKHKSNETKIKHTNTNLSTKVTESHLTVSKVPLSVAKKRRNTISACKTEDKITSALKICDKKVFGCESVIPHYHRLSFDNKIEKIKGKQTNVDKRRTSLDSSKTHSLVNQETLQKNNRRDKDLYENQKGDLNTQSPSQPHLPKMRLITNYNSSTIQPINLCNNDSSPKSIPLNKPETHRKNDKNINKTGEGNIKTRSFSQSNLPLIPVPINENSGVKESLKLNISPLQVVHVHNPPQIQSEVAHTQIIGKKNINKTHKDDNNSRSPSQSKLPLITVPTNQNNGVKVSIPLNDIPSLRAVFPHNPSQVISKIAQTHISNKKNIKKTHKDDINTKPHSKLNSPLMTVPTNEHIGVKVSIPLNEIPSLQAVSLHNPSQGVAQTLVKKNKHINEIRKDDTNTKSFSETNFSLKNKNNGAIEPIMLKNTAKPKPVLLYNKIEEISERTSDVINLQPFSQSNLPSRIEPIKHINNSRPKAIPQLEPFQENYSNINVNLSHTINKGIDVLKTAQEIRGCNPISSGGIPSLLDKSLHPSRGSYNPPISPIQTVVSNRPSQELKHFFLMPRIPHRNPPRILPWRTPTTFRYFDRYPIFNRLKNAGVFERNPCRTPTQPSSNIVGQVISPLQLNIFNTNITSVSDDDETNIGEINNISNECPAGNSVEKTSSAHSSGVTNSNVIKLPIKEYSSPIAPILSHSSILDILNTTDYDFPLLSKQPDNCTENDFSLLSERSDESLEHLEAERINTF